MAVSEKTISGLLSSQIPDFINADHPKFKKFIQYYYEWLETNNPTGISNTAGNTIYHAMNIDNYRDIDNTPTEFIQYFIRELLPYFPENTSLDITKILKSAREFYSKKGSLESVEWLFRALYGEDITISYPKESILVASDGKWKKPLAFRVLVNERNKNIDVNLLERRVAKGNTGGATCLIESANRTVDPTNGREIIELYISNLRRYFENGEFITIFYKDANGVQKTFSEKIIGTISNVRLDSNIKTDPQQKRRGLLYNVGDPVVFTGGLADTLEAEDARAIVGNVTVGSIEGVTILARGFGFRPYQNSIVTVLRSPGDDPLANSNTDLRIAAVNTASNTNGNFSFSETIYVDKTPIIDLEDTEIGDANLEILTITNRNIVLNLTENDQNDDFNNLEDIWADGLNYATANFKAKIATANGGSGGPFGAGGASAYTGDLVLYEVSNTGTLSSILTGNQINTRNTAKSFTFNSITSSQIDANANSRLVQILNFEEIQTGGIDLISVIDGGAGFRSEPALDIKTRYGTNLSEDYAEGTTAWSANVQTLKDLGAVCHVYINNAGSGYVNGETISFAGSGYGGNGYITVGTGGAIRKITLTDRGEGYSLRPNVVINTTAGTGANLTALLFGDGFNQSIITSAIGRIIDIRLLYRGFDYVATPNVSLKVVDVVIDGIADAENLFETEYVYQGNSLDTSTFRANVDSYIRDSKLLRLYNYSSNINTTISIVSANGVTFNVNTLAVVPAPSQYPTTVVISGLPNPMYFGNGLARANAQFANGIIQYNGFFLNTDGFLSADKRLQDGVKYHKFSYELESEKSLDEYNTTLKNIIHPVGLQLVAKTVSKSEDDSLIKLGSNVNFILEQGEGSTVNVTNSFSNVVTGTSTTFLDLATKVNVGDLFTISSNVSHPLRSVSKTVTAVSTNTSLEVEGDFLYVGQGKLTLNTTNTIARISGNTNTVSHFLTVSDSIKFNLINVFVYGGTVNVSGDVVVGNTYTDLNIAGTVNVSGNVVRGNTTGGNTTYFVGNVFVGNIIRVNSEIKTVEFVTNNQHLIVNSNFTNVATNAYLLANNKTRFLGNITVGSQVTINSETRTVVTVSNDNHLIVNSNFTNATTNKYLYANTILIKTVQALSRNNLTLNTAIYGNTTHAKSNNLVYMVVPNFNNGNYAYNVVTLTSGD